VNVGVYGRKKRSKRKIVAGKCGHHRINITAVTGHIAFTIMSAACWLFDNSNNNNSNMEGGCTMSAEAPNRIDKYITADSIIGVSSDCVL